MQTPDWNEPLKVEEPLAETMARLLGPNGYEGVTAADIHQQLALPHDQRSIIGMFTIGSLEEAWGNGWLTQGADGIITAITTGENTP